MAISEKSINRSCEQISPLYQVVETYIYDQIKTERFRLGQRIDSVKKIADILNVSTGTVQQALQTLAAKGVVNRKPRMGTFVSKEPNLVDSSTNQTFSKTIALLVPDTRGPEFSMLSRALQDTTHEQGFDTITASTDNQIDRYSEILTRQLDANVYGIILVPPLNGLLPFEIISAIKQAEIPVVTCYREINFTGWPSVMNDMFHAAYLATRHLAEKGCRNIASISWGNPIDSHMDPRHHGYLKAIIDKGIPNIRDVSLNIGPAKEVEKMWPNAYAVPTEKIKMFLKDNPHIDGIVCSHDCVAAATLSLTRNNSTADGKKIKIVGCGDIGVYFGLFENELTTLTGQYRLMAEKACELLVNIRQGRESKQMCHLIKSELKVGKSTENLR